jgi:hypothetical protein
VVLAGLAGVASFGLTRRSPLLTTDSASYLSAAANLLTGRGLTTAFDDSTSLYHPQQAVQFGGSVPFAHFGPLYPLVLAGLHFLTLGPLASARAIGVLSLAVTVVLLCRLADRAFQGSLPLMVLLVVVSVLGPSAPGFLPGSLFELSGEVLSEPLFYVLLLGALVAGAHYLERGGERYFVGLLALAFLATLTRYIGASVALAVGLASLGAWRSTVPHRVRRAVLIMGAGLVPLVGWPLLDGWLSGGSAPRELALHLRGAMATEGLSTATAWFFPAHWPTWFTGPVAVALVIAAAVLPLSDRFFGLLPRSAGLPRETQVVLRVSATFISTYLAVVVVSGSLLDASLSFDQRVLGPVQIAAYLVLLSIAYWSVRCRVRLGARPVALAVASAVALLVVVPAIPMGARQVGMTLAPGVPSSAMLALAGLPSSTVIVTNEPSGVFVYAHRGSILAPVRSYVITGQENPGFRGDLEYIGTLLSERPGVVVLVPDLQRPQVGVADFERWAGLRVTWRFADGTVFLST